MPGVSSTSCVGNSTGGTGWLDTAAEVRTIFDCKMTERLWLY
jgi:hypothetical protein